MTYDVERPSIRSFLPVTAYAAHYDFLLHTIISWKVVLSYAMKKRNESWLTESNKMHTHVTWWDYCSQCIATSISHIVFRLMSFT